MKTKFILHGGNAGISNNENDAFFKEILKDTADKVKVLLVYFAKDEKDWERMVNGDIAQFRKNGQGKELFFDIASENNFISQIEKTDVIYFHGGKTLKLLEALKKYPNLEESLLGKIVAGESAGAYVLSDYFYSKTEGGIFSGLGFVPVKIICHYVGENKEKLDECQKEIESLLLEDYQFKVFYK